MTAPQTPTPGVPLSAENDPRMTDAEANPLHAIQYAVESWQEYGDANDAMTFLDMWQQGDLSESAQYRDWCRLTTPSDKGEASGMDEILRRQAKDRSRYLNSSHATTKNDSGFINGLTTDQKEAAISFAGDDTQPASGLDGLETVAWWSSWWGIGGPARMVHANEDDAKHNAEWMDGSYQPLVTREAAEKRIGELAERLGRAGEIGLKQVDEIRALQSQVAALKAALPDLSSVIGWLENGGDPKHAATELRIYQDRIQALALKEGR